MSIWPFHPPNRPTPLRSILVRGLPDGATVQLERDNPSVDVNGVSLGGLADLDGVVPDNLPGQAINLHIRAAGYVDYDVLGLVLHPGNLQLMVGLPLDTPAIQQALPRLVSIVPPFVPLPALRVRGQFFEQVNGTRITLIETSDFNLLNIFQHQGPEAAHVIAQQRSDLGFNLARVWTRYTAGTGAGQFLDIDYAQVGPFLDFMGAHGLYVDLTAYTGRDAFLSAHWNDLGRAVAGHTNVLLSLANENDQANNTIDLGPYQPWPGVLCSKGSNGSRVWPPRGTGWQWAEMHFNEEPDWFRQTGHNAMEVADAYGVPVITNENKRLDKMGDPAAALLHLYDSAQGATLLCAGNCFHSIAGKQSTLFAGFTLEAAQAHVAGAKSLPLTCQDGGYVHRADLEGSTYLRVYQRGSDPDCIARIRP